MSLRSRNRKTLHDWLVGAILPSLSERGLWSAIDPAPLTVDEVVGVFEKVVKNPMYEHQTLRTETEDGWVVVVIDGKVTKEQIQ